MTDDHEMSRSMRIALENWERSQPGVQEIQRITELAAKAGEMQRMANALPDAREMQRITALVVKAGEMQRMAGTMPTLQELERATSPMPNVRQMQQAMGSMPALRERQGITALAAQAREMWRMTGAMPTLQELERAMSPMPDLRKIQRAIALAYNQRQWQETMASFEGADELYSILAQWSDSQNALEVPEGIPESPGDTDNELTSVDAKRLELFLILLVVLPRVAPKLDAAVVADLLRWHSGSRD